MPKSLQPISVQVLAAGSGPAARDRRTSAREARPLRKIAMMYVFLEPFAWLSVTYVRRDLTFFTVDKILSCDGSGEDQRALFGPGLSRRP